MGEKLAKQAAESGQYEKVYLGSEWETATGQKVPFDRAPAVIGVRKDGKIDVWEVESKTDNAHVLMNRIKQNMDALPPEMRGDAVVARPRGIQKDVNSANSKGKALTPERSSADADAAFRDKLPGFIVIDW